MLRKLRSASVLVVVSGGLGLGCQSKATTVSPTPASASAKAAPGAGTAIDEALLNELEELSKTCQPGQGDEQDRVRCAGGKDWRLIGDFLGKRRERGAAVATLAKALAEPDPGLRRLTVSVLRGAFASAWGKDTAPGKVEPGAASALLDAVLQLPAALAEQALPAAVNAAVLAGLTEALYGALEQAPHAGLRPKAYSQLMTLGRLQTLPKVKELAASQELDVALSALDAPFFMDAWSPAEESAICAWAAALVGDARPEIAAKVDLLVAKCSGGQLDGLLTRIEKLAADGKLDVAGLQPLVVMCTRGALDKPVHATTEQCARAREIFVGVAVSQTADPEARVHALRRLVTFWPDAKTKAVLERSQNDGNAEVARQARKSVQALAEGNKPTNEAVSHRSTPAVGGK